jgi:L-seryl-tRNA(Ser) seleniumtransferase
LIGRGVIEPTDAFAGGGALPEERIASFAVVLNPAAGAETAAEQLRAGRPPVVGRIHRGRLLLDMLAVSDEEVPLLAEALRALLP